MIPEGDEDRIHARRRSRAVVMAVALGLFVILMFAITIAKMSVNR